MTLYVDELLVPASVERLAGLGYWPVSKALRRLRQGVCEGEALVGLLRALWDLVLNDPELDRRLEAAVGGDVVLGLIVAEGAVAGLVAQRRSEVEAEEAEHSEALKEEAGQ